MRVLSTDAISEARKKAIPLLAELPGKTIGGTGFLARILGEVYLMTAAHIGQHQLAVTNDWSTWACKIEAVLPDGDRIGLPLFTENASERRPRFHSLQVDAAAGKLLDTIALGADQFPAELERLEQLHGIFDVPAHIELADVGQRVFVFGFPTEGSGPWPQRPTPVLARTALESRVGVLLTEPGAETGYSGGPVVYPDGGIAGLLFGEDAASGNGAAVGVEAFPVVVSQPLS